MEECRELKDKSISLVEVKDRWESIYNDNMATLKAFEDAIAEQQTGLSDQLQESNTIFKDMMGQCGKLDEALIETSSLIAKLNKDWKLKEASFQEIFATMRTQSEGSLHTVADLQYKFQDHEALLTSLKGQVNSLQLLPMQAEHCSKLIQLREAVAVMENLNKRIQSEEKIKIKLENLLKVFSVKIARPLAEWEQQAGILRKKLEVFLKILEGTEQLKNQ